MVVVGSSLMLADSYIDKEDNSDLAQVIISFLVTNDVILNQIDADDPDITDYSLVPSLVQMAERPRVCLQRPSVVSLS